MGEETGIEEYLCHAVSDWLNHTKEGPRRSEIELIESDKLWSIILTMIKNCEKDSDPESADFVRMVKYEGELTRIHKKYVVSDPKYGIKETSHYLSWTKSKDFANDFYWLYKGQKFLQITSHTTPKLYGIDLVGFSDWMQKYYYESFRLGAPSIYKEQEVVFPLLFKTITETKIIKL